MPSPRGISFAYGNWATGANGFTPIGVHNVTRDRDTFSVSFDVLSEQNNAANLATQEGFLQTELNRVNQRFRIVLGGQVLVEHDPNAVDLGWLDAAETRASFTTIDEFDLRSDSLRAYRITVSGSRLRQSQASRAGSFFAFNWAGKRAIDVQVGTTAEGLQSFALTVTFIPHGNLDAQEVAEDGTLGWAQLVSAVETALTGNWDEAEPQLTRAPEDRFVTYAIAKQEILFGQSETAPHDATLTGPL